MHALVVGRFQPLHLGHVALLKAAAQASTRLTVGIGSSNARPSLRNPFTATERRAMLEAALAAARIPARVVDVPDVHDPPNWVAHVLRITGPVDLAAGNDDATLDLFEAAGIRVLRPGLVDRARYEARVLRAQMAVDDPAWRKAVPAAALPLLDQWDASRRLRAMEAAA